MKNAWLIVSIVPLLVYGNAMQNSDEFIADQREVMDEMEEEDLTLAEFLSENPVANESAEDFEQEPSSALVTERAEDHEYEENSPRAERKIEGRRARVIDQTWTQSPHRKPLKKAPTLPKKQAAPVADKAAIPQQKKSPKTAPRPVQRPTSQVPESESQMKPQSQPKQSPKRSSKLEQGGKKEPGRRKKPAVSFSPQSRLTDNYGDSSDEVESQENRKQFKEKNRSLSMNNSSPAVPMENTWDGHRKAIDSTTFWVDGQFLWWQANENGLDYAVEKDFEVLTSSSFNGGVTADGLAGDIRHAHYDWSPGFRLDAGYRFDYDAWEVFAEYTWVGGEEGHSHAHLPSGSSGDLVGTFPQVLGAPVEKAHSKLRLGYQVGDLALARRFELSKTILFRFFAGPRGAWMHRDWDVHYKAIDDSSCKTEQHWGFKGYGIQLGLNTDWHFGWGFTLFAQGSASALYGEHHDHVKTTSSLDTTHPFQRASLEDHRSVQSTQLAAGLGWQDTWGMLGLKIYAAWEMNSWYSLAEHYRTISDDATSRLITGEKDRNLTTSLFSMQGLTLGVTFEF